MKVLQIACVVEQGCDHDVIKAAQEQDERHAWDAFAAAALRFDPGGPDDAGAIAAVYADSLLAERRQRWGGR